MPLRYVILSKVVPASFPPVSCSFPEPHPGTQGCLYNLLEGQPENSWPLGGEYCITSNPSRCSGLHGNISYHMSTSASLSEPTRVGNMYTMPARTPSLGISSKAIGLPGINATLGVSPAGHLDPNPYHPSPKVTDIFQDQISTPLLWNI